MRFIGLFIIYPRYFIACAPGFVCSPWVDLETTESGRLTRTVTLQHAVPPCRPPGLRRPAHA